MLEILVSILLLWIGITDWKEKRIPNWLVLALFLLASVERFIICQEGILDALLGSVVVGAFLLLVMLLKKGAFGMGDVKLMGASGIWLGLEKNVNAFCVGVVLAAVFCLVGMCFKRVNRKSEIPFGPFLCMGIFIFTIQ